MIDISKYSTDELKQIADVASKEVQKREDDILAERFNKAFPEPTQEQINYVNDLLKTDEGKRIGEEFIEIMKRAYFPNLYFKDGRP